MNKKDADGYDSLRQTYPLVGWVRGGLFLLLLYYFYNQVFN